jgi:hypothetical protein
MVGHVKTKKKHHDWHHRKPRSLGPPKCCAVHDPRNYSHVSVVKHRAWHTLFGNMPARDISLHINEKWLDPDFYFVCVPRYKKPRVKQVKKEGRIIITITYEEVDCE